MMKFIASSVDAAKAKAHRALGEKAVIVSVRNLPSGDIEVSASDRPAPAAPPERVEPAFADETRFAISEARARPSVGARLNEALEQRFGEDALSRLRGDLTRTRPSERALDMSDRTTKGLTDILGPHGVGEALMLALIDGARGARIDEDLYRLEAGFEAAFSFAPLPYSPSAPIMLVGPTGAGKTSSAAKLAAAAIAESGGALILTADSARAGAVDQLRTYSDALGADYFVVETPFEVDEALKSGKARAGRAVILDTPGVSPYDAGDIAALRSFRDACGAEPVLVLPASGDAAEFRDWAHAFRDFGVRRTIVTKFDATRRVGAALNAAHAARLALAHFSESAFISEGLIDADAEFLARRLMAARPGPIG